MTARTLMRLAVLLLAQAVLLEAFVVLPYARPRAASPCMMCMPREAPPAPPGLDLGYGGDGDDDLILATMSTEERQATLSLWKLYYEHAAEPDDSEASFSASYDAITAGYAARWVGDMAPTGWLGRLSGRTLGAYLGGALQGVAIVRFEVDTTEWQRVLFGKHLVMVDEVVLAPSVPEHVRGMMHAGIVQRLIEFGHAHQMSVAFWEDFDI